jgi:hypothetical protein
MAVSRVFTWTASLTTANVTGCLPVLSHHCSKTGTNDLGRRARRPGQIRDGQWDHIRTRGDYGGAEVHTIYQDRKDACG